MDTKAKKHEVAGAGAPTQEESHLLKSWMGQPTHIFDRRSFLEYATAMAAAGTIQYVAPRMVVAQTGGELSPVLTVTPGTVQSVEATIGFDIYGNPSQPPTMLAIACADFDVLVHLANVAPRTVMHVRGTVRSPANNTGSAFTLAKYMTDANLVISAVQGGSNPPTALYGYSHGGYWATRYALAHPSQITSLVLIEPALFTTTAALNARITAAQVSGATEAARLTLEDIAPGNPDNPTLAASIGAFYQSAPAMAGYLTVRRDNPVTSSELASLAMPVLLIKGGASAVSNMVDQAAALIPNSQVVTIGGANHLTLQTGACAEQVANAIMTFQGGGA